MTRTTYKYYESRRKNEIIFIALKVRKFARVLNIFVNI